MYVNLTIRSNAFYIIFYIIRLSNFKNENIAVIYTLLVLTKNHLLPYYYLLLNLKSVFTRLG